MPLDEKSDLEKALREIKIEEPILDENSDLEAALREIKVEEPILDENSDLEAALREISDPTLGEEVVKYFTEGIELHKQRDYEGARRAYERVIQLDPKNIAALNNLGRIFHLKRDPEKAIEIFREALKHDPENPVLHYNLANSLRDNGDHEEAITEYNRVKLLPVHISDEEEIEKLRSTIRSCPLSGKAHYDLGRLLYKKRDQHHSYLIKAISEFRAATKHDLDNPFYYETLGNVLQEKGDTADAMSAYQEAAKLRADIIPGRGDLVLKNPE